MIQLGLHHRLLAFAVMLAVSLLCPYGTKLLLSSSPTPPSSSSSSSYSSSTTTTAAGVPRVVAQAQLTSVLRQASKVLLARAYMQSHPVGRIRFYIVVQLRVPTACKPSGPHPAMRSGIPHTRHSASRIKLAAAALAQPRYSHRMSAPPVSPPTLPPAAQPSTSGIMPAPDAVPATFQAFACRRRRPAPCRPIPHGRRASVLLPPAHRRKETAATLPSKA